LPRSRARASRARPRADRSSRRRRGRGREAGGDTGVREPDDDGGVRATMSRRHLHNLCALLGEDLDVERARDEYLASLDADEGLAVLLISDDEILAAASKRRP